MDTVTINGKVFRLVPVEETDVISDYVTSRSEILPFKRETKPEMLPSNKETKEEVPTEDPIIAVPKVSGYRERFKNKELTVGDLVAPQRRSLKLEQFNEGEMASLGEKIKGMGYDDPWFGKGTEIDV